MRVHGVRSSVYLERFPLLERYSEEIALGLVVAAITFLSLVVGELMPKRIALNNPERIAALMAGPMTSPSPAGTERTGLRHTSSTSCGSSWNKGWDPRAKDRHELTGALGDIGADSLSFKGDTRREAPSSRSQ
jgi:hypothetical protein